MSALIHQKNTGKWACPLRNSSFKRACLLSVKSCLFNLFLKYPQRCKVTSIHKLLSSSASLLLLSGASLDGNTLFVYRPISCHMPALHSYTVAVEVSSGHCLGEGSGYFPSAESPVMARRPLLQQKVHSQIQLVQC